MTHDEIEIITKRMRDLGVQAFEIDGLKVAFGRSLPSANGAGAAAPIANTKPEQQAAGDRYKNVIPDVEL